MRNKLEYSALVRKKIHILKKWLMEHFDKDTSGKIISEMISDAERLTEFEKSGTNISEVYSVDTEYWYLFTHQHYLIYKFEPGKVVIVQMFNEKEDFMMKLFGVSGRTQESIDFWGE